MATNDYGDVANWLSRNPAKESSGRWDASGRFEDAVEEQRLQARDWARNLTPHEIRDAVLTMANDTNAFTLYERKAILETVVLDYL